MNDLSKKKWDEFLGSDDFDKNKWNEFLSSFEKKPANPKRNNKKLGHGEPFALRVTRGRCCQICGFLGGPTLVVHHVVPRAEGGGNGRENLIVLCPNCHAIVHHLMRTFYHIYGGNYRKIFGDWVTDQQAEKLEAVARKEWKP